MVAREWSGFSIGTMLWSTPPGPTGFSCSSTPTNRLIWLRRISFCSGEWRRSWPASGWPRRPSKRPVKGSSGISPWRSSSPPLGGGWTASCNKCVQTGSGYVEKSWEINALPYCWLFIWLFQFDSVRTLYVHAHCSCSFWIIMKMDMDTNGPGPGYPKVRKSDISKNFYPISNQMSNGTLFSSPILEFSVSGSIRYRSYRTFRIKHYLCLLPSLYFSSFHATVELSKTFLQIEFHKNFADKIYMTIFWTIWCWIKNLQ